jgi:two-component system, cell cycle sensor histidine kinase and response regulator CckA
MKNRSARGGREGTETRDRLRIVILEDSAVDAELMEKELQRAGLRFASIRVETRTAFCGAIRDLKPDLILADYTLPKFDALSALKLVREKDPRIPFIIVTGSVSEEVAINCMKQGVDDYLLKDRLARLGEAVRQALDKSRLRREKAEADAALQASEFRYRTFVDASTDMVFLKDNQYRHVWANPALCRFFGRDEKDVLGKTDFELMGKKAAEACRRTDIQTLKENSAVIYEESEGGRIFETRKFPVRLAEGRVGVGGYIRDITDRKLTEEKIRETREFLNRIINAVGDPIFVKDSQHRIILANDAECALIGRDRQEIIGKTDRDFFPGEQVDLFWKRDDQVLKTGEENINEEQITDSENTVRTIVTKKTRYTDPTNKKYIVGVIRDITERKRAEEESEEAALRWETTFNAMADAVCLLDESGAILKCNQAMNRLFGLSPEKIVGRDCLSMICGQKKMNSCAFRSVQRTRRREEEESFWRGRWFHVTVDPILSPDGKFTGAVHVMADITAQKESEGKLRSSEERYRQVFDLSGIGIGYYSPNGRLLLFNLQAARNMGGEPADFVGRELKELYPGALGKSIRKRIRSTCQGGTSREYEDFAHLPTGDKWFLSDYTAITDESGKVTGVQIISRDITDRKRGEEELKERDRLLQNLSEQVPGMIYTFKRQSDGTYCIPYCSSAIQGIFGVSAQDVANDASAIFRAILPEDRPKVVASIENSAQTLTTWQSEYRVQLPGQPVRWTWGRAEPFRFPDGSILWYGFNADISERKRTEETLAFRNILLSTQQEASIDGILVVDENNAIISYNSRFVEMMGIPHELIALGSDEPVLRFVTEQMADPQLFLQRVQYLYEHKREDSRDEIILKDGRIFDRYSSPMFGAGDLYYGRVWYFRDITERKRTEKRLAESERKYRELVENANSIILHWTNEGRITFLNEFGLRFFGYTVEEIIGRNVTDTIVPMTDNSGRDLRRLMDQIRADPDAYEHNVNENMRRNGERVWIAWTNRIVQDAQGQVIEILSVGTDITERKKVEEALRESEERFRSLYENATIGLYRTTPDGRILMANPALVRMLGHETFKDLSQHNLEQEGFEPEYPRNEFRQRIETQGEVNGLESAWKRRDGKIIFVRESAKAICDENGNVRYYEGTVEDITERKRSETAMRRSEERYRVLFEESKDVVYSTRQDGTWVDINPAGIELFGYPSREEMLSGSILDLYADLNDKEKFLEKISRFESVKDHLLQMKKKDGRRLEILVTSKAIRNKRGEVTGFRGTMHDVTEARKLEQQLMQSQKMEAIGRLAGGIAHDFNNLLTVINGYGELLLNQLEEGGQRENVQNIVHAAQKATALTRQILSFSRKQIAHTEVIRLGEVMKEFRNMIGRILGEDIEWKISLADDLDPVLMDVSQLGQVILNIVVNARDAMPQGGKLTIEARNFVVDDDFVRNQPGATKGKYVRLTISDTGPGMSAEVQEHIFEPFFTTKKMGEGTGLGLSTVYGIVKQASGQIIVESEKGKGTAFHIFFPSLSAGKERLRSPEALFAGDSLSEGRETVLVVEDEEGILELIVIVLSGLGYTVLAASGREEAKTAARERKGKIDLMISDIVLPGIEGPQLFEEMKKIVPGIRVVFMSGYAEDRIRSETAGVSHALFLGKPFTPQALAKTVRRALDDGK